ncbi:DNA mismatch repair endonuclease MutL [Agrobacterium rubi]|nr:DNA mismatch repair endonuclease MutL [Agrobacterium rubi]NTF24339.1 DNA mismatch repair endonuclease MutL [Agrobacterium rubi]
MPIRILPPHVAAMIAAGEVVDRPASVVKELLDNAIDSGATRIDVSVRGANHRSFIISDNGSGMPPEDLAQALHRHATSKMDHGRLSMITTLGFRGEALPSIAAVSEVSIVSRPAGQDVAFGTRQAHGGPISPVRPCAGGFGTVVSVAGLFDETPARLKFLKSAKTERAWIRYVVDRAAIANPQIAFSLSFQTGEPTRYRSASARERIADVLGAPLKSDGLWIEHVEGPVRISGMTTMPSAINSEASSSVDFFVNGRHVSDRQLSAALQQPYRWLIGTDKLPHAAIMISVPSEMLDVNVHPRKSEIRFSDPALVTSALSAAVSDALNAAGLRSPGSIASLAKKLSSAVTADVGDTRRRPLGRYVGQSNGSWLIAETMDGLVIIDQHAAHERVILERLKASASDIPDTVVRLPSGVSVAVDDFEAAAVDEHADVFSTMGFTVAVSDRKVTLITYPSVLSACSPNDLLTMLVSNAGRGTASGMMREAMWEMLATAACKAAIKAGDALTPERGEALLREIEATPAASHCNHGRPTVAFLNNMDLGKLFERS